MAGLFDNIKADMLRLIKLSADIAKYNERLLHCSDMQDKRNFDAEKRNLLTEKISELQEKYDINQHACKP